METDSPNEVQADSDFPPCKECGALMYPVGNVYKCNNCGARTFYRQKSGLTGTEPPMKYQSTVDVLKEMSDSDKLSTMKNWLGKSVVFPYEGKSTEVTFSYVDSKGMICGKFWGPRSESRLSPQIRRDLVERVIPAEVKFDLSSALAVIIARESPPRKIEHPQRWQDMFQ